MGFNIYNGITKKINYNTLEYMKKIGTISATGALGLFFTIPTIIIPIEVSLLSFLLLADEMTTKDLSEIKKIYDEIIKDYNKINKDFNFNNPVAISALFHKVVYDGYLSKNSDFMFTDSFARDIRKINGVNVINGGGVCRHISAMLNDIYNDYGMKSNLLGIHANKYDFKCEFNLDEMGPTKEELHYLIDYLGLNGEKKEKILEGIDKILDSKWQHVLLSFEKTPEKEKGGNHAINLVVNEGMVFFLDATNAKSLKLNRECCDYLTSFIDDKIKIDWKSFSILNGISPKKIKNDILLPSTSYNEDMVMMKEVDYLYKDNLDIFEKFYTEHHEGYEEVSNKLMKIKRK